MSSVESLLQQLREATDKKAKSKLRAQLRKLGHRGGSRADGETRPLPTSTQILTPEHQGKLPFRSPGKGQNLDKQFAAKVEEEENRPLMIVNTTNRKHVGKRAKVKQIKTLPENTFSKPPMRGRLCMNCDQTCVWDHRREVWECPQCHPDSFTPVAWPTALYNAAKKMLPVSYALGFAPDYGWFVYKDAKPPYTGYERIGKFESGPLKAVKAVM